jgi:predicted membrane-bound spermidine synthase
MTAALCVIFFLSGVSALIFESLWFQLAGRVFGSSLFAASIVLTSFMAGLALGNGFAAYRGSRVRFPVRLYAVLELVIAVTGFSLVLLFPHLTSICADLFRHFLSEPLKLNALRSALAMGLMIIPTTAMGMTLPILVRALYSRGGNFGNALGLLYGWNTFGAVAGVLASELYFIKWFGILGTGLLAALFNIAAAVWALSLWRRFALSAAVPAAAKVSRERKPSSRVIRLLVAAFLSGFTLLALEMVWFRFMALFFMNSSLNFAIMLAVVLAGISSGGLLASRWFRSNRDAHLHIVPLLALNAILVCALYGRFNTAFSLLTKLNYATHVLLCSIYLMLPISFISGIIFTMFGRALHKEIQAEAKASGLLVLSNTIGAASGSLAAGLIFIPQFGIEASFALLAGVYLLILLLFFMQREYARSTLFKTIRNAMVAGSIMVLALFPRGLMENVLSKGPIARFLEIGAKRVAFVEGLNETIQYTRQDILGRPYYYRQITNSYRMSGTMLKARRYMRFFAYLPLAIHRRPKNALLIGYGCGTTSSVVFPGSKDDPINDPRVTVHIEDGRFFLLASDIKFDIITAEPPPPKNAGIANLYSQEYFQLIYNSLAEGGVVTYWLPMHLLVTEEAKAIMKAFSNVFDSSSLWSGNAYDWVMVGVKEPQAPATERAFRRQWKDPAIEFDLRALGFTSPEEFGSFFIADGKRLRDWISDEPPLVDNYPRRLSYRIPSVPEYTAQCRGFMDPVDAWGNFSESVQMQKIWPASLRRKAERYFESNRILCDLFVLNTSVVERLHQCIQNPLRRKYILWALFSDEYALRIIDRELAKGRVLLEAEKAEAYVHLAARAVYDGDYQKAVEYYTWLGNNDKAYEIYYLYLRIYLLYLAGDRDSAEKIGRDYIDNQEYNKAGAALQIRSYYNWLGSIF